MTATRHFALDACLEATDIRLRARNIILLRIVGSSQRTALNRLLLQIAAVIALKGLQLAALHLQNAHSNIIEEGTVMADNEQTALKFLQILFQPLCHNNVQMVCRFVQNHKVGITHQCRRQHQTCFLTAAQRCRVMLPPILGVAQTDKHTLNAVFVIIAVNKFVTFKYASVFLQAAVQLFALQLAGISLELCQLLAQAADFRAGCLHKLPDSTSDIGKALLYIAHTDTGFKFYRTAVNPFRLQQATQQRRLAAAVDTDKANMLALLHHKAYIFKYFMNAKCFGDFIYY